MLLKFATCERHKALDYLRVFYPNHDVLETDENVKIVLDHVENDIVRIPDPVFHPEGCITPSRNWDESIKSEVIEALTKMHNNLPLKLKGE